MLAQILQQDNRTKFPDTKTTDITHIDIHKQQVAEDGMYNNKSNIQRQQTIRPKNKPIAPKYPHAIAARTRSRMKTTPHQSKYDKSPSNHLNDSTPSTPPPSILPPPRIPPMHIPTPKASTVQLSSIEPHHAAPLPRVPLAFKPSHTARHPRVVLKAPLHNYIYPLHRYKWLITYLQNKGKSKQ